MGGGIARGHHDRIILGDSVSWRTWSVLKNREQSASSSRSGEAERGYQISFRLEDSYSKCDCEDWKAVLG